MMLKVGITGGIGSGKSTVCQVFETLGIPVFYADDAAKHLMQNDKTIKQKIIQIFGTEAYIENRINNKYISKIVFSDSQKLQQLNQIIHPATIDYADKWVHQQKSPYIIKEAALFFESGSNKSMDWIIGIAAPLNLRIERVLQRDQSTKEEVLARINKQMDQEEKMALCDFVIINDEKKSVIDQVLKLHLTFLEKANVL